MITFIWNWWDIRCKYIMLAETIYDPRASKGKTFKSLVAWKRSLPRPKFFFENLSPSSTLSYTSTKKSKRVNLRRQSQSGFWSSWGSLLIALSLGFTVMRVLFRFLIENILFRILGDRFFFESSEIGFSSLGHAVIDSSLQQLSFSAMSLLFYQTVLLLF